MILETPRLYLRHFKEEDAFRLSEYRNKKEVAYYQTWNKYSILDAKRRIAHCLRNPEIKENRRVTWKEYELIESGASQEYRREITWGVFNEKANRFANLLLQRGVKKGDKVAILMMNGLEWLPIYFGILKTGALVVPMNYRYSSDEIKYCLDLADVRMLVFGPEFIDRINAITNEMWTMYEIYESGEKEGEYKLYIYDENAPDGIGQLYEGTQEEADESGIKVVKKQEKTVEKAMFSRFLYYFLY